MTDIEIVPLREAHWPEVRLIYADGIASGNATFETEPPDWQQFDHGHAEAGRIVAVRDGAVAGWAALAPVSARAVYRGVAEVSVYVAAAHRGAGVGRALLAALVERAEAAGFWTLQAAVFPENVATLALHSALGFRLVGRRQRIGQLHGRWRDTLLLERRSGADGRRDPIVLPPGGGRRYAMGAIEAVFKADEAETAAAYSVSEWWLDPLTTGPGAHRHPLNDEVFIGIEGTMAVRVGDRWHDVQPGGFLLIPAGMTHDFENRTRTRAALLNVFVPGGFERNMPAIVDAFRAHPPRPAAPASPGAQPPDAGRGSGGR